MTQFIPYHWILSIVASMAAKMAVTPLLGGTAGFIVSLILAFWLGFLGATADFERWTQRIRSDVHE